MHRNDSAGGPGIALGVLTGAVIGAGVTLLLAPKAGRALRSDIAESVDALKSSVASRYQAVTGRAGEELEHLRKTVHAASRALKSATHDVRVTEPEV